MNNIILSVWDFWKYRIQEHGIYYMISLTDSYYPRFFSMGYYDSKNNQIFVAKIGNWKLRLKHEQGHADGLKHTSLWKVGSVMHPWGILRGPKL